MVTILYYGFVCRSLLVDPVLHGKMALPTFREYTTHFVYLVLSSVYLVLYLVSLFM